MKAYFANGLFSEADIFYNSGVVNVLRQMVPGIDIYLPQENEAINDKNSYADSIQIFEADKEKLMASDFLIAVIDGVEIDSGVAAEIGLFASTGKPIYALYTDSRQNGVRNRKKIRALKDDATENQFAYRNLFVIGLIKSSGGKIFSSSGEMVTQLANIYGVTKGELN